MRILVVGGAGYIGSHVCKALLGGGHEVVVLDNFSTGRRENLLPGAEFRHGDILLPHSLNAACKGEAFDGLVHLAALKAAGESMLEPEKYSTANIIGSLNLIHAAIAHDIKYFVFSSSAAVYGEPQKLPVDEEHPKQPANYYGFTKLQIESYLDWYSRLRGLKYAALRYFNAAGYDVEGKIQGLERNPGNLLPVIMEAAVGMRPHLEIFGDDYDTPDGTGVRDYVHVDDLAVAHVRAMEYLADKGCNLVVNLGSENGASVKQILKEAEKIAGRSISHKIGPRRPGDPAKLVASSAKAGELLDWKAAHSDVETLVRTTWNAYRANLSG